MQHNSYQNANNYANLEGSNYNRIYLPQMQNNRIGNHSMQHCQNSGNANTETNNRKVLMQ